MRHIQFNTIIKKNEQNRAKQLNIGHGNNQAMGTIKRLLL